MDQSDASDRFTIESDDFDDIDLDDVEVDYATVCLAQDKIGAPRMLLKVIRIF